MRDVASRITNDNDTIDSRDICERIEELENELESWPCPRCGGSGVIGNPPEGYDPDHCPLCDGATTLDFAEDLDRERPTELNTREDAHVEDKQEELRTLRKLVDDIDSCSGDAAKYGVQLIRDRAFEDHARELAEDCGMVKHDVSWPYTCIDWEQAARELQQDYSSIEYDGVTYWVR